MIRNNNKIKTIALMDGKYFNMQKIKHIKELDDSIELITGNNLLIVVQKSAITRIEYYANDGDVDGYKQRYQN